MASNDDKLLVVAALLGVAAYLLVEEPAAADVPNASGGGDAVNGYNNNNPGNVEYISGDPYNGQVGKASNGTGIYDTLSNGVRAMGLVLTKFYNEGYVSIAQIIPHYSATDQAAYIANVSAWTGFDANEPLSWPTDEVPLIQAMVRQEQGFPSLMSDQDVATYIAS